MAPSPENALNLPCSNPEENQCIPYTLGTGSSGLLIRMFKVGYWIAKTRDVFMPRIVRILHKDLMMPIL